jgi:hypothetical protein
MPVNGREPDLSWLADAPVFIDAQQLGAFYDAVVGREFKAVQLQLSADQTEQLERSASGSVNVNAASPLFGWLKIGAGVEARRTQSRSRRQGHSVVLEPVESPSMRLVQLTLHYLSNQPERIRVISQVTEMPAREDISASPRMLAFIDVPRGTMFLPQAAELDNGRVVTFFDALTERLQTGGGSPRADYPANSATEEGMQQRDTYWKWYAEHWKTDEVVKAVEEVIADGGRPRWIDYKMSFATGDELNLHVDAHGDYDTGLFAYNLIRRGWRYGLRIVGSLKSQPALNVLAIYEKLRQAGSRQSPRAAKLRVAHSTMREIHLICTAEFD